VPIFAQIMFFGALLSAIKSCASRRSSRRRSASARTSCGPFFPGIGDHKFLQLMRIVLVAFTCMVTLFAVNSDAPIYKMVENAYKVTLVGAFVPLVCGLYWKRATNLGALLATVFGLTVWIWMEFLAPDGLVPPQLAGLVASFAGMLVGSLVPGAEGRPAHAAP
jgi:Na+/proline symporter